MGMARFDKTASRQQETTFSSSSNSMSDTMKCFSLFTGVTAVHLLFSNFFGFILFTGPRIYPLVHIELCLDQAITASLTKGAPDPWLAECHSTRPAQSDLYRSVFIFGNTLRSMLEMAGHFRHRELRGLRIRGVYPCQESR